MIQGTKPARKRHSCALDHDRGQRGGRVAGRGRLAWGERAAGGRSGRQRAVHWTLRGRTSVAAPTTEDHRMPLTIEAVTVALATVQDPEIHKPITELGMVKNVDIAADGRVLVEVYLTVSGCPLRDKITRDVTEAVRAVEGVTAVDVELDVMSDEQRRQLQTNLRGGEPDREIPFAKPGSLTRVYAVASGKGGVGKSSVTVNLAAAMVQNGLKVGVVDADIYGFSIPRMLGVEGKPTQVESMIMPPTAHGVKVISIGMFVTRGQPVVWRGPMLHRALQQFLGDVYWGDLDVLLLDLPPGTGDIAISVAQLIPSTEILVVTTPQLAAREVAERAGSIALQTHQQIVGVVENMSGLACPHCGDHIDVFGTGGGGAVAEGLTRVMGAQVPLLGQVPIDVRLREGGDTGVPLVLSDPDSPAANELRQVAERLGSRARGLAGRSLSLSPAGR
jgi:ATP-binding protein involved in chromosome partitioning